MSPQSNVYDPSELSEAPPPPKPASPSMMFDPAELSDKPPQQAQFPLVGKHYPSVSDPTPPQQFPLVGKRYEAPTEQFSLTGKHYPAVIDDAPPQQFPLTGKQYPTPDTPPAMQITQSSPPVEQFPLTGKHYSSEPFETTPAPPAVRTTHVGDLPIELPPVTPEPMRSTPAPSAPVRVTYVGDVPIELPKETAPIQPPRPPLPASIGPFIGKSLIESLPKAFAAPPVRTTHVGDVPIELPADEPKAQAPQVHLASSTVNQAMYPLSPLVQPEHQTGNHVVVSIPDKKVVVYGPQGNVVREFPAYLGKKNAPTPEGQFRIMENIKPSNAEWYYGPRWLGFAYNYDKPDSHSYAGFHGWVTNDARDRAEGNMTDEEVERAEPGSKTSTHGCVQLANRDVAVLGQLLGPGDPVTIVNRPLSENH